MTGSYEAIEVLDELAVLASGCTLCGLHETRTNVVFGAGDAHADVMIVGEGPGQQEDEQGIPFVGRSGQLLDTLLGEIGIERSDVYIANVVKCRPPRNRDPRPEEIDAWTHYLHSPTNNAVSQDTAVQPPRHLQIPLEQASISPALAANLR